MVVSVAPLSLPAGFPTVRDYGTFWPRLGPGLGLLFPRGSLPTPQAYGSAGVSEVMGQEKKHGLWRPRNLGSNPDVFIYELCDFKQMV